MGFDRLAWIIRDKPSLHGFLRKEGSTKLLNGTKTNALQINKTKIKKINGKKKKGSLAYSVWQGKQWSNHRHDDSVSFHSYWLI